MSLFFQEFIEPLARAEMRIAPGRAFLQERKEVTATGDGELLSVSEYTGVTRRRDSIEDGEHLTRADSLDGYRIVRPGNLVINYMLAWKGALGVSDLEGITSPAYAVFQIDKTKVDRRFAHALFRSNLAKAYVRTESTGIIESRLRLYPESLLSLRWVLPPLEQQERIAGWLDRETARIDALIEKKTRFIELLREKRQALITQAVTSGLDPSAPMKDSGVEWLAQIPAHWAVKPLKLLVRPGSSVTYGIVQPGDDQEDGVPFVQTTNISRGDFKLENLQRTTAEIAAMYPRSTLVGGEVILGIRASIGAAYLVPHHLRGANLSRGVARIDCSDALYPTYLVQFLRSSSATAYWELCRQGSTFNEVSIETVREMPVPVPPLAEQAEIATKLGREQERVELLIEASRRSIALLSERRAALITAAVTGQIDVRAEVREEQPEPA